MLVREGGWKVRIVRYIHVSYARKFKHTVTTIPQ